MASSHSSLLISDYPELSVDLSPIELFILCNKEDICDRLMRWLPWPDITCLSSTSTVMRAFVNLYRQRAWATHTFFEHWFEDQFNRFRSLLALTGALVTGEQLIRFFDRRPPDKESNLDVVTRVGGAGALVLFLEHIGYQLEPDAPSTHSESNPAMSQIFGITSSPAFENKGWVNGVLAVLEFTRPVGDNPKSWLNPPYDRCARMRVVIVAQDPVDHVMTSYHSSEFISVYRLVDFEAECLILLSGGHEFSVSP